MRPSKCCDPTLTNKLSTPANITFWGLAPVFSSLFFYLGPPYLITIITYFASASFCFIIHNFPLIPRGMSAEQYMQRIYGTYHWFFCYILTKIVNKWYFLRLRIAGLPTVVWLYKSSNRPFLPNDNHIAVYIQSFCQRCTNISLTL